MILARVFQINADDFINSGSKKVSEYQEGDDVDDARNSATNMKGARS